MPRRQLGRDLRGRADTVFFLHIPRTGGTALRHMLERSVDRSEQWKIYDWDSEQGAISADRATIARYRLIVGHYRIGVWTPFEDQPFTAVLREPVSRLVSSYRYNRMYDNQIFHAQAKAMDLDQFVASDAGQAISNTQTYVLSTRVPAPERTPPGFDRTLLPVDAQEAIAHLSKPSVIPGITEESDRAVALLSAILDIEPPALVTANESSGPKVELNQRSRDQIRECNALDIEVYEAAMQLFWDKWRDAGAAAEAALVRLQQTPNRLHQLREWQIDSIRRARNVASRIVRR
jgi:hypothetical protein